MKAKKTVSDYQDKDTKRKSSAVSGTNDNEVTQSTEKKQTGRKTATKKTSKTGQLASSQKTHQNLPNASQHNPTKGNNKTVSRPSGKDKIVHKNPSSPQDDTSTLDETQVINTIATDGDNHRTDAQTTKEHPGHNTDNIAITDQPISQSGEKTILQLLVESVDISASDRVTTDILRPSDDQSNFAPDVNQELNEQSSADKSTGTGDEPSETIHSTNSADTTAGEGSILSFDSDIIPDVASNSASPQQELEPSDNVHPENTYNQQYPQGSDEYQLDYPYIHSEGEYHGPNLSHLHHLQNTEFPYADTGVGHSGHVSHQQYYPQQGGSPHSTGYDDHYAHQLGDNSHPYPAQGYYADDTAVGHSGHMSHQQYYPQQGGSPHSTGYDDHYAHQLGDNSHPYSVQGYYTDNAYPEPKDNPHKDNPQEENVQKENSQKAVRPPFYPATPPPPPQRSSQPGESLSAEGLRKNRKNID